MHTKSLRLLTDSRSARSTYFPYETERPAEAEVLGIPLHKTPLFGEFRYRDWVAVVSAAMTVTLYGTFGVRGLAATPAHCTVSDA
jgi:hypothetical protein